MSIRQAQVSTDSTLENNAAWQIRAAVSPKIHTRPNWKAGTPVSLANLGVIILTHLLPT